jgi:hypothetical protein
VFLIYDIAQILTYCKALFQKVKGGYDGTHEDPITMSDTVAGRSSKGSGKKTKKTSSKASQANHSAQSRTNKQTTQVAMQEQTNMQQDGKCLSISLV